MNLDLKGFVIKIFQVAKKASVLRRRKSRSKMDANNISASQTIDPSNQNQNDNDDYVFYVEDNKFGECNQMLLVLTKLNRF